MSCNFLFKNVDRLDVIRTITYLLLFLLLGCGLKPDEAPFILPDQNQDQDSGSTEILGEVTTFAGKAVYDGDNGTLKDTGFASPNSLAYDSSGNLFVSDYCSIRKITSSGLVSTLAGIAGSCGSTDGTGSVARFNNIWGMAIDSSDNIFVVDLSNATIRKVTPQGVVTTFAGSAGVSGSTDGTGSNARFSYPIGIAIDSSDNLYVTDRGNHTIRKITPAAVVTTFAGMAGVSGSSNGTGTSAKFYYPAGITIDSSGNLYVADEINHLIRKITPAAVVTTFAGSAGVSGTNDGTGTNARFYNPRGITIDSSGNLFVADSNSGLIRKITTGAVVTTLCGGYSDQFKDGTGSAAAFYSPEGLVIADTGNLIVADLSNQSLRQVTPAGVVTTISSRYKSYDGTGVAARFRAPRGLAVDSHGNVFVAEQNDHTIRKITPDGVVTTFAGLSGVSGSTDAVGSNARFYNPTDIAIDNLDNLFVTDLNNNAIRKITPAGLVSTFVGSPAFNGPFSIAVDSSNYLYVADFSCTVRKISPAGVVSSFVGTENNYGHADGNGVDAQFYYIHDLTVDQDGNIFVADVDESSGEYSYIRKITPDGDVSTVAGGYSVNGFANGPGLDATFGQTLGITNDGVGNLYVADANNYSIRKIDSDYNVTTLAGSSTQSPGRDDGVGTSATFNLPFGITFDPSGILYVSDIGNRTIRKID